MSPDSPPIHVNTRAVEGVLAEQFRFAPQDGPIPPVPRHAHETYQLVLTRTNPGYSWYRGARLAAPAHALTIIHPGEAHAIQSARPGDVPAETRLFYLAPTRLESVARELRSRPSSEPSLRTPVVTDTGIVRALLHLHRTLLEDELRLAQDERLLGTLAALLQRFGEGRAASPSQSRERHAVTVVREYLHAHHARNVSLAELAVLVDLSPFHLAHAFRRVTGTSPHAYLLHVRIDRAKTLLAARLPSAQVALEVGFAHQSHFGRHFKRLVGVTPATYAQERDRRPRPGSE